MQKLLKDFIPYLRCPITAAPLKVIRQDKLNTINTLITGQHLYHADGSSVKETLEEALITEDEQFIYPIVDGEIMVLLDSLAIKASDSSNGKYNNILLDAEKQIVQDFYDAYGWQKSEDNSYRDTVTFEDRREVAAVYWRRCHLRLNRYLNKGKYILDVASGAIPNDEYFTYSDHFQVRICMDFSLLALQEAARRLNHQGIFILGDMTKIPFTDECVDAVISLHTVYHIPKKEQNLAVSEAYRILKPEGKAVIVYSWKKSPLMYWTRKLWKLFLTYILLRNKAKKGVVHHAHAGRPELFIHQHNYSWFANVLKPAFNAQLKVYSGISRSFSHTFIRGKILGKWLSGTIYRLENIFPGFFGRYGQYPVFVLHKKKSLQHSSPQLAKRESVTTNI